MEEEGSPKGEECDAQPTKAPNPLEGVESQQMEIVEEADDEEMEFGRTRLGCNRSRVWKEGEGLCVQTVD